MKKTFIERFVEDDLNVCKKEEEREKKSDDKQTTQNLNILTRIVTE